MSVTSIFFGSFPKPEHRSNRKKKKKNRKSYTPPLIILPKATPEKLLFARKLIKEMTPAETALWKLLKENNAPPIEPQKVVYGFITDFWCQKYNTCIEVDGMIHLGSDQMRYDTRRDAILRSKGLKLIRFSNDEVFRCGELVIKALRLFMTNNSGLKAEHCRTRFWLKKRPAYGKDLTK